MNSNTTIAAAIAAVLGTAAGSAFATAPGTATTPTQAASPTVSLYIAGSSAASAGVLSALESDLCGDQYLLYSSTSNKNFFAVSCEPASGVAGTTNATTVYTVWYRDEGGSVVGALPVVTGYNPKQLDLTQLTGCATNPCTPTILGASTGNGTDDSFTGALVSEPVQFGILDVEPSVFGLASEHNYPTAYSNTVWNPSNIPIPTVLSGLTNLASGSLFDEVYGIFVNNASLTEGGSAVSTSNPLKLSEAMVANILSKSVTNWSLVTDVTGNPVASGNVPIVIVNRETGSGSRAATDLLITGDACKSGGKVLSEQNVTGKSPVNVDYFATGDVLTAANTITGAITYATIDQTKPNLSLVSLNGITPSNLAAAAGQYDFWVEASYVVNPSQASTFSPAQSSLVTFLTTELQNVGTTPHLVDIDAIPTAANGASATLTAQTAPSGLGGASIYINPFTRAGTTCSVPGYVP
jgi:ABC-type phosphate transport system substrate-binding protein